VRGRGLVCCVVLEYIQLTIGIELPSFSFNVGISRLVMAAIDNVFQFT
jgi:hypothetical protein